MSNCRSELLIYSPLFGYAAVRMETHCFWELVGITPVFGGNNLFAIRRATTKLEEKSLLNKWSFKIRIRICARKYDVIK